jgi:hypothetical protein
MTTNITCQQLTFSSNIQSKWVPLRNSLMLDHITWSSRGVVKKIEAQRYILIINNDDLWIVSQLKHQIKEFLNRKLQNKENACHKKINKPIRSITAKLLLIYITRKKFDVTTTTLNILLKFNRILNNQGSVLISQLWYLCGYGKMLGIIICLNTCKNCKTLVIIKPNHTIRH